SAKTRYAIGSPYVLYVGNFKPHKNVPRLIRAFALLPGSVRSRHSLVLAGGYGDGRPELARLAETLGLADRVLFAGRVDDADLRRRALARAGLYAPARTTGRVLALLREVSDGAVAIATSAVRTH